MSREITAADLRLARRAAGKYRRQGENSCDADFESAAMQGLAEAARTFNGKGSWEAYARRGINNRLIDLLRWTIGPMREHCTTIAPDDLPDTAAPNPYEITNPYLDHALARLPEPDRRQLLAGDIDRRRPRDRALLATLRAGMTTARAGRP